MTTTAEVTRIEWDAAAYDQLFHDPGGPLGAWLEGLGQRVEQAAKQRAPVSRDGSHGRPPGYLRDHITHQVTGDADGLRVDIISAATTPEGYPYGLGVEVGTVAHIIRSHGPYPLRNRATGQVFGPVVHHPGTSPHPHLRPALETLRYG